MKRLILLLLPCVASGDALLGVQSQYNQATNDAPVWTCTPSPAFVEGVASSYSLCVTEPEGEAVTIANETGCTLPTGVSIDSANKELDATSGTSEALTTGCVLSADDGTNAPVNSSAFTIAVTSPSEVLAFPSAMGFGKNSTGGRGGEVYYVTTTANSGAGSLRDALITSRTSTPRNILFAVCGRFPLSSNLTMRANLYGNVYVAGQTAPCPVVITDEDFAPAVPNGTFRFLTFLQGGTNSAGGTIEAGYARYANNMIFDHVSAGWHDDEVFDILGGQSGLSGKRPCANMYGAGIDCPENFTIQNSIIAEGTSGPDVGKGLLTYGATNISSIRNLLASNYRRSPLIYDNVFEAVNNVIYNYSGSGERAMSLGGYWDIGCHSIIGNHFKDGPGTIGSNVMNFIASPFDQDSSIFLQGNRHRIKRATDGLSQTAIIDNLNGATSTADPPCTGQIAKDDASLLDAFVSDAVYTHVLANAGNQKAGWTTDPWTDRILSEAGSGTAVLGTDGQYSCVSGYNGNPNCDGSFVEISDIGGYPTFESDSYTPATVDTDLDGITNACEDANGTDDEDDTDGSAISANGYTNLENFLNYKAGDSIPGGYNAC